MKGPLNTASAIQRVSSIIVCSISVVDLMRGRLPKWAPFGAIHTCVENMAGCPANRDNARQLK